MWNLRVIRLGSHVTSRVWSGILAVGKSGKIAHTDSLRDFIRMAVRRLVDDVRLRLGLKLKDGDCRLLAVLLLILQRGCSQTAAILVLQYLLLLVRL